jgi:hypothetical protein
VPDASFSHASAIAWKDYYRAIEGRPLRPSFWMRSSSCQSTRLMVGDRSRSTLVAEPVPRRWHCWGAAGRSGRRRDQRADVRRRQGGGLIGRHLTFVPLAGITIGPDNLQVTVSKEQVKSAPSIELHGDELSRADESTLDHHYQLNNTRPTPNAVADSPAADTTVAAAAGRAPLTRPDAAPGLRPALRASSATGPRSDGPARVSR